MSQTGLVRWLNYGTDKQPREYPLPALCNKKKKERSFFLKIGLNIQLKVPIRGTHQGYIRLYIEN